MMTRILNTIIRTALVVMYGFVLAAAFYDVHRNTDPTKVRLLTGIAVCQSIVGAGILALFIYMEIAERRWRRESKKSLRATVERLHTIHVTYIKDSMRQARDEGATPEELQFYVSALQAEMDAQRERLARLGVKD